jgi:hypothetical protein
MTQGSEDKAYMEKTAQSPEEPDDVQWTVMVFMGVADDIKGTAPLKEFAKADLEEMTQVGSGGHLELFVQIHGFYPEARRGRVTEQLDLQPVPAHETDMAGGMALQHFISSSLMAAKHDPRNPNHFTMLVLWGHAYDFAIDHEQRPDGTIDALDFAELSDLLRRLQRQFGDDEAKLHILAFDACDVATVELACQLQPFAHYLLGSQIGVPMPGWPYDRILERVRKPHGRSMRPAELGTYIVRRFCESYRSDRPVSLSLLNLNRTSDLFDRIGALCNALAPSLRTAEGREWLAYLFEDSVTGLDRPFVDLADLCLTLVRQSGDRAIAECAAEVGNLLISPQPPLVGRSATDVGRPFVVENGRNAGFGARLNGVSAYAPHLALRRDYEAVRPLYQNFTFAQQTRWSDIVHTLARLSY